MNKMTASRIKELRIRKGFSQEELADGTGLNLRTIQRIENGETEPLGNSIRRIAQVLETTPEELIDPQLDDDTSFLKVVNISALAFLLFPVFGIILPYILWQTNRNRIKGLDQTGRAVVNFQITWTLLYFIGLYAVSVFVFPAVFVIAMYGANIFLILFNTVLIHTEKEPWYHPKVSFLKA